VQKQKTRKTESKRKPESRKNRKEKIHNSVTYSNQSIVKKKQFYNINE